MSNHIIVSESFVELFDQQQEFFSGGQNLAFGGGQPIAPLSNAIGDGSETKLSKKTIQGATTSGPAGSIGDSFGQGSGAATGASDSMILPPFVASTETK